MRLVYTLTNGAASRVLPVTTLHDEEVIGAFTGRAVSTRGYTEAVGTISKEEFDAYPAIYVFGTTLRVTDADDANNVVWAGRLLTPAQQGGKVVLKTSGWGKKLEKSVRTLYWQERSLAELTPGDTDPFDYQMNDEIDVRITGRAIIFRVPDETIFKNGPKIVNVIAYEEGTDLTRIAFDWESNYNGGDEYDLELCSANGPNGALSVFHNVGLNGTSGSIDELVDAPDDLLSFRFRRDGDEEKADGYRLKITNIRINGLAVGDSYFTSQMMADIAAEVGGTTTGIVATTRNGLPMVSRDAKASEAVEAIALIDDRPVGIYDDGAGPAWKYHEWGAKTYQLVADDDDEIVPVLLDPVDPYTEVVIPYRTKGGVRRRKRYSVPDINGIKNELVLPLEDPLPPVEVADIVGPILAASLSQTQFAGGVEIPFMEDVAAPGVRVSPSRLKPGDELVLTFHGGDTLRVDDVELIAERGVVIARFPSANALIERFLAVRRLLAARGRGPAGATLGALGLGKPAKPTFPSAIEFNRAKRKKHHNDINAIVDVAHSGLDVRGNATVLKRIRVELRPVDGAGTPIPEALGGKVYTYDIWRKRLDDLEPDESLRAIFRDIERPFAWLWQRRAEAFDVRGKSSGKTTWAGQTGPGIEHDPPAPLSAVLDIDQHKAKFTINFPPDDEDPENADQRIHRGFWKLKKPDGSVYAKDHCVSSLSAEITTKIQKPGTGNWSLEAYSEDSEQRRSAAVIAVGNKVDPATQTTAPTITFDRGGKKGIRAKVAVPGYSQSYLDDDIKTLVVELQAEDSTPSSSDPVRDKTVKVTAAELTAGRVVTFGKIKAGEFVRARYFVEDTKGHQSGKSNWSTVYIAAAPRGAGPVQNLDRDADEDGKFRTITWRWNPPVAWSDGTTAGWNEDEVAGYDLTPRVNGVEQSSKKVTQHKSTQFTLKVPIGSGTWTLKVEPVTWDKLVGLSSTTPTGTVPTGVSGSDIDPGAIDYSKLGTNLGGIITGFYGSPSTTGSPPRSYLPSGPSGYKAGDLLLNLSESPYRLYKNEGGIWYRATDGSDLTVGSVTADKITTGTLSAAITLSGLIRTAAVGSPRAELSSDAFQGHLRFYDASAQRGKVYQTFDGLQLVGFPSGGGSGTAVVGRTPAGVNGIWSDWAIYADGPMYEFGSQLSSRYAGISHGHGSHSHGIGSDGFHSHTYDKTPSNHGHGGSTGTASGHSHSIATVADSSVSTGGAGSHNHGGTNPTSI